MIIEAIFDEHDCEMCVHSTLAEDFSECPFFEKKEESEDCRNFAIDLSEI